jgi:pimeloyl-ACP methyl ester carboxylesterase
VVGQHPAGCERSECETGAVVVKEVEVDREGVVLAGSIWFPDSAPKSVIVMHPGSGPSDRNNDTLFAPIRTALLASNHAVASFDKRGVGASTGSLWTTSVEQQASDLLACIEAVSGQLPSVPVGAFGHSQGGWVVYEAAGTGDLLDFAIANSGPGVSPRDQERHALRVATADHRDQSRAMQLFDELVERARRSQPLDAVLAETDLSAAGELRGFATNLLSDANEWSLASLLFSYDPTSALHAIDIPLLCVFGREDPLVPIDDSVEALRRLVSDRYLEVRVFDGAGHRLEPKGGHGFVDGYLDAIADFATRRSTR